MNWNNDNREGRSGTVKDLPVIEGDYSPIIQIDLPFCLYLQNGTYKIITGQPAESFYIDVEKVWRSDMENEGELLWDKRGIYRHTRATIHLSPSSWDLNKIQQWLSKVEEQNVIPEIISQAITCVNQLVNVYRYVTKDHYLYSISDYDIGEFRIGYYLDENKETFMERTLTFTPYFPPWFSPIPIKDKSKDIHNSLRKFLKSSEEIPFSEELLMNAKDWLERGNYRLAVMEAQTAFEVFVKEIVSLHYSNLSRSEQYINNVVFDCGFKHLLKDHLSNITLFNEGVNEYENWFNDAYLPRNKSIHQGYKLKEIEAHKAIKSIIEAMHYLK